MSDDIRLEGMVPRHLTAKSARIFVEQLEVHADIGFHEFEVGTPQSIRPTEEALAVA